MKTATRAGVPMPGPLTRRQPLPPPVRMRQVSVGVSALPQSHDAGRAATESRRVPSPVSLLDSVPFPAYSKIVRQLTANSRAILDWRARGYDDALPLRGAIGLTAVLC